MRENFELNLVLRACSDCNNILSHCASTEDMCACQIIPRKGKQCQLTLVQKEQSVEKWKPTYNSQYKIISSHCMQRKVRYKTEMCMNAKGLKQEISKPLTDFHLNFKAVCNSTIRANLSFLSKKTITRSPPTLAAAKGNQALTLKYLLLDQCQNGKILPPHLPLEMK